MTCVIIDLATNFMRTFTNDTHITFGRNYSCSINIPNASISRNQCDIKQNDDNEWIITDSSSHKTTTVNKNKIHEAPVVLKSGDTISFQLYDSPGYVFYESPNDLPSNYCRKRKPEELFEENITARKKIYGEFILALEEGTKPFKQIPVPEHMYSIPSPVNFSFRPRERELKSDINELIKYKELYEKALEELEKDKKLRHDVMEDLNNVQTSLEDLTSSKAIQVMILENEKKIMKKKLKMLEDANEKLIGEVQDLMEVLKESELEQVRLTEECKCGESKAKKDSVLANSQVEKKEVLGEDQTQENDSKSNIEKQNESVPMDDSFHNDDLMTSSAIQKIVELVEVNWTQSEMKLMQSSLKTKTDQLTDLTLKCEKHKQELLDTIDRELVCSVCSEILYDAITLNCKHTFCRTCVIEWKTKKKDCPVCRTKIKFEVHPLVIDSFIDKLFDIVGGDLKARRMELKNERDQSKHACCSGFKGFRNDRRGSGARNRSSRRGGRRDEDIVTLSAAMGNAIYPQVVIDLRDAVAEAIYHQERDEPLIDLTVSSPAVRRGGRRANY